MVRWHNSYVWDLAKQVLFRLGITLHAKIEEAMDVGAIAIVPIVPEEEEEIPTEWRCVLIKESYRDRIFSRDLTGHASRWNVSSTSILYICNQSSRSILLLIPQ